LFKSLCEELLLLLCFGLHFQFEGVEGKKRGEKVRRIVEGTLMISAFLLRRNKALNRWK